MSAHRTLCSRCRPQPGLAATVAHRTPPAGPRTAAGLPTRHRVEGGRADLLVVGHIVTMDPDRPAAGALAVAGGRILAVGDRAELEGLRDRRTRIVELGDHVAYPGFIDPHVHLGTAALFDGWLDCSPQRRGTFDDVLTALRLADSATAHGQWVLGHRFEPARSGGRAAPSRQQLDGASPHHPALVLEASMRVAHANSAALAAAGLTDDTPDPTGGALGRRAGHLDGTLVGAAAIDPVLRALPRTSHDDHLDALTRVALRASARGVTGVHEAGIGGLFGVDDLDLLHLLSTEHRLPLRVTTAQLDDAGAAFRDAGLRPGAGDDMVRAVSWKIVADGSIRDPFDLGGVGTTGPTVDDLATSIERAVDDGWQVMVHAESEPGIEHALDAFEKALAAAAPADRRHRVEHCSLATGEQLTRMAAMGLTPSFRVDEVRTSGRAAADLLGSGRAAHLAPVATARSCGHRVSFHSDDADSDPLRSVQTALLRQPDDGGAALGERERDEIGGALRAITIDAAWQNHTDHLVGSLESGKAADLVILAADPATVDPDRVAEIDVIETYLDGERAQR